MGTTLTTNGRFESPGPGTDHILRFSSGHGDVQHWQIDFRHSTATNQRSTNLGASRDDELEIFEFFGQWDVAFDGRLVASFGYIETTGHRFGCTRRIVGVDVFSVRRQAGREEFVPIGLFPFLNRAHPLHNGAHIRCCCWPLCCGENSTLILSEMLLHISEWK
ncbi:hypothetical protein T4D_11928 [Trichinella pseudospiralis]|uniref:Uncharacterized protein n=1 Tax=Trichinella pseudospiralis TaxID=6337 RepID=A0A0V1FI27_TRIPS|nr:hypothetical protein T4D_11928 [Trichinella pseudospiralis]